MQHHRLENINRLLDETTWAFVDVYRQFASAGQKNIDWRNALGWIIRMSYACVAHKYCKGKAYWNATGEASFNTAAYNHQCGNNTYSLRALADGKDIAHEGGACLAKLVHGSVEEAVRAGKRLQALLVGVERLGDFNAKEILWHGVLLREAFDFVMGRRSHGVRLRKTLFEHALYGTGGLRGLTAFYPAVTHADASECAADLRRYLETHHDLRFHEGHDLQWALCMLQKTLNVGYSRTIKELCFKDAECFSTWHARLATYPLGLTFFKSMAENVGAGSEFSQFLDRCTEISKLVEKKNLEGDSTCRVCWRQAGVQIPANNRNSHATFGCDRQKPKTCPG